MSPDEVVTALTIRNKHVLLPADSPCAVLDAVAAQLAVRRSRVLRPLTLDVLTLPSLLAELVAQVPKTTLGTNFDATTTPPDLERGFELLTDPGSGFHRVVFILDRADALDLAALRYVQFAAHAAPLHLLFAGGPGLRALLEREEFGLLRRRFVGYAPSSPLKPASRLDTPVTSSVADPTTSETPEDLHAEAFPGGAEAALEFAAFEKHLAEGGPNWRSPGLEYLALDPPGRDRPIQWHAPVSEPGRRSTHWLLAGAGMAFCAAAALLLINSGLLARYLAQVFRTTPSP